MRRRELRSATISLIEHGKENRGERTYFVILYKTKNGYAVERGVCHGTDRTVASEDFPPSGPAADGFLVAVESMLELAGDFWEEDD